MTIFSTTVISKDETYHGWPTVALRKNGELLVVSSSGREEHVCPFGKVRLQRSNDNGKTWSDPEVVVDGPLDDRDAGVLETSQGTIIVSWFTSLAWMRTLMKHEMGAASWLPEEQKESWRRERDRINKRVDIRAVHGEFIVRSTDGGRTWSEPIATGVNSPHGPIELMDGTLFYIGKAHAPFQDWEHGSCIGTTPITAAISTDDGITWENIGTVPCAEGHDHLHYHEPHAVQAADGRIIVQIRNHNTPGALDTIQSESADGGRTWSIPTPLPFGKRAHPPHLLRLRDSRLMCTVGYREEPFGNRAFISEDNGKTWSEPFVISEDGAGGDLGYPSTTELADGSLITVWYESMEGRPKAVLRQAHWSI